MLGFSIMRTKNIQMSKLEKEEEPEIKFAESQTDSFADSQTYICWSTEKAREFQQNVYLCSIDYAKAFDCVVWSLGWEDPLEKGKATYSGILVWRIHPMDSVARGVAKSRTWLSDLHFHFHVDRIKLWKALKETGIPHHLTSLLRNLCAS